MDKFREDIRNFLSLISDKGKLLFGVLTFEKLYPNYVFFEKATGWGKHEVLREGSDLIYQHLIKNILDKRKVKETIVRINTVTPDTEDFPEIFASFALDACTSIYSSLSFLLDGDIENIIDIAVYARDTVDMFIQERTDLNVTDSSIELKIANDPLMIREMKRQNELIQKLKSLDIDALTIQTIENLWDNTPIIEIESLNK